MSGHLDTPWRYRPKLRPASGGGLPSGIRWDYVETPAMFGLVHRSELPVSRHTYGIICTDRMLTTEECEHFDLHPED